MHASAGFSHPDRVLYPLKRSVPPGSGQGQQVGWKEESMNDIGARLADIVARHGAEVLHSWPTAIGIFQPQGDKHGKKRLHN
jgi:anaerobic selenocysteine-containing dehydrogenase